MEEEPKKAAGPFGDERRDAKLFLRPAAWIAASVGRGVAATEFWHSDRFWKGVVVGLLTVVLIKTLIAVHAPYGILWYDG